MKKTLRRNFCGLIFALLLAAVALMLLRENQWFASLDRLSGIPWIGGPPDVLRFAGPAFLLGLAVVLAVYFAVQLFCIYQVSGQAVSQLIPDEVLSDGNQPARNQKVGTA